MSDQIYHPPLRPFTKKRVCRKCKGRDISRRYCTDDWAQENHYYSLPKEHFDMTCRECGYKWFERVNR